MKHWITDLTEIVNTHNNQRGACRQWYEEICCAELREAVDAVLEKSKDAPDEEEQKILDEINAIEDAYFEAHKYNLYRVWSGQSHIAGDPNRITSDHSYATLSLTSALDYVTDGGCPVYVSTQNPVRVALWDAVSEAEKVEAEKQEEEA